jgi:hypothetical protein
VTRSARVLERLRLEWRHFYRGVLRGCVFVLGDSHAKVFEHLNAQGPCRGRFDVTIVGGATTMGLVNPNSCTDCLRIFQAKLATVPTRTRLLFLLGEVDTGFVIWYRALKHHVSVEEQLQVSLANYFRFVNDLLLQGRQRIALMSAPLPTLPDNHERHGEVARLRREVTASQRERTELTLRYNRSVGEFCRSSGLTFIDLDAHLLGEGGLIQPQFLNRDPLDHHCDTDQYGKAILEELRATNLVRCRSLR